MVTIGGFSLKKYSKIDKLKVHLVSQAADPKLFELESKTCWQKSKKDKI
jgi:hypothetical protein